MKPEKRRFLIVDDEPDMCWALENILIKKGPIVEKASSAREALALINSNSFDFVFLDAKLPDIEGLELAKKIRDINPSLPIVIISGYFYKDDEAIHAAIKEKLILHFISKPFLNDEILKVIERGRFS